MGDGVNNPEVIRQKVKLGKEGKAIVFEPQIINPDGQDNSKAVGEAKEALLIGQKSSNDIDTHTWFEKVWTIINETADRPKKGEALVDAEISAFNDLIDNFPSKEKNKGRALRKDMAEIIVEVNKDGAITNSDWKDLSDPTKADAIKVRSPKLGTFYNYIQQSGGDPGKLDWKIVSAYGQALVESFDKSKPITKTTLQELVRLSVGDPSSKMDLYEKLLAREGYADANPKRVKDKRKWKNQQEREKALDLLLGLRQPEVTVDPVNFLRNEFYERAVRPRLTGMRSSAVSYLEKGKGGQKMEIGRPKDPRHFEKGFSPALVFQTVSDETQIGKFLDQVGHGAYWRGKASLDVLYWSLYKGQILSNKESLSESKDSDLFAKRDTVSQTARVYGGAVAISYMEKDPKFTDTLNVLYGLNQGLTYEDKLKILAEKYNFKVDGELPDFITDAVMFEKVYVLDAMNMSRADLRKPAYHPAQTFENELVTDAEGRVMQLLGKNMRFTESPMMKMGWWDASNVRFNYEATVPDKREFDLEKNWDQRDKIWQHCGMYLLEIEGRSSDLKRKYIDENEKILINGEPMTATMGQTGEFLNYQNERIKIKAGKRNGEHDHRKGVYDRISQMKDKNVKLIVERGVGMAGWDDRVVSGDPASITIKEAVVNFVTFCHKDFSGINALVINGVTINKAADEIFYNDELAILLNSFEEDPRNPVFNQHRANLEGFLNMRNVLRNLTCWGFIFDLNDPEVQKRLFNNQDITFVENYDISANKSKSLLRKLTSAEATSDTYALKITPGQILEAVTEFGHRRHNTQNYWPMMQFIAFAEAAMIQRLTEMEIASMQDLSKYIDPMGEVKLGATEEIVRLLGIRDEAYLAHKSLLGEIDAKGYMDKMKDQRLVLAEKGLIRNWTNAMRSYVEKLRDAEALGWAQQRDIPLQQMAGIYEEIADGYEESGKLPVESWQVMDVVVKDYTVHRRNLLIQSLNRMQIETFFDKMSFEEAGEAFGGARKIALDFRRYKDSLIREEPNRDSHEVENAEVDFNSVKTYLMTQRQINGRGEWFKIATNSGESVGWVNANDVDYSYDLSDNEKSPLRRGEVTYQGGRFVWKNEGSDWRWKWIKGSWQQSYDGMESGYKFVPGEGFERRLKLGVRGNPFSVDALKGTPLEERNDETLQETKVIHGGMIRVQPANYPFLKFKSEEHREYFYNMRQRMLLSLTLGRPIQADRAVGVGAESPRISGAALPGNMYKNSSANFTQMLQFGYWITTQMRSVELYAACRGALIASLKRFFGIETPANEITEKRMELFKMLMQSRIWGKDAEAGKRFISEISAMAFVRHGDKSFTERLKEGSQKNKQSSGLRIKAALLRFGIKGTELSLGKLNLLSIVLASWPTSSLATLTIAGGLAFGWTISAAVGSYLLAKVGVDWVGGILANQIDPDISNTDLSQFKYLREYDAFVPVE